jgi:hypothetical protein
MVEKILNPDNWQPLSVEEQLNIARQSDDQKDGPRQKIWANSSQLISPLSFYKYLKARFGPPNGFVMFLKNRSSDNLIHWQYSLRAFDATINIWGKTSGIEISVKQNSILDITENEWQLLVENVQNDYKKYSKEMSNVGSQFEHWSLFINPFSRIERVIKDYVYQLEKLNLTEAGSYIIGSKGSYDSYKRDLKKWIKNITKAASLGTTIRMLCPVMAESFINLILLVFRKSEYAKDERLYENLIRQQIDIRVKTLHLHCTCFPKQIDSDNTAFKNFHTLMNRRNDFLHGNIDPNKLIVEEVWFDERFIPLFKKDEGVIKKMLRNYCSNVEPENAIGDFQRISGLIELILMSMDDESLRLFVQIMADQMPGINKKTKRLGVLFPSGYLVENYIAG